MAIVQLSYDLKVKSKISVKQYLEMYRKATPALKEPGQKFARLPPDRHNEVDNPKTRKLQVFPWIFPTPFNHMVFGTGKYATWEKLFLSFPIFPRYGTKPQL